MLPIQLPTPWWPQTAASCPGLGAICSGREAQAGLPVSEKVQLSGADKVLVVTLFQLGRVVAGANMTTWISPRCLGSRHRSLGSDFWGTVTSSTKMGSPQGNKSHVNFKVH